MRCACWVTQGQRAAAHWQPREDGASGWSMEGCLGVTGPGAQPCEHSSYYTEHKSMAILLVACSSSSRHTQAQPGIPRHQC